MSDKYTLAEVTEAADLIIYDVCGYNLSAMLRQLLDDHETMRRALEGARDWAIEYEVDIVQKITEKALGEVTK